MSFLRRIAAIPDRLISYGTFGVCGVAGMQVPKYLDSLEHEFRGALTEATREIEGYIPTANAIPGNHAPSNIADLVQNLQDVVAPYFEGISNTAVNTMAGTITEAVGRYEAYDGAVQGLQDASWVGSKIQAAVAHYDADLVRQTWDNFTFGMDFSTDAIVSFGVAGFAGVAVYALIKMTGKGIYHKARGRRDAPVHTTA